MRGFAFVSITAAVAACTAFGTSGDAPADSPTVEGGADQSAPPSGQRVPPADGDADTDGGALPFCQTATLTPLSRCVDFDGPVIGDWGGTLDGGTIDRGTANNGVLSFTAPGKDGNGLLSRLPAGNTTGAEQRLYIANTLAPFSAEADILIDTVDDYFEDGAITLFKIAYGGQSGNPTVEVQIQPQTSTGHVLLELFFRGESGVSNFTEVKLQPPFGSWFHLVLTLDVLAQDGMPSTNGVATVTVNGGTAVSLAVDNRVDVGDIHPPYVATQVGLANPPAPDGDSQTTTKQDLTATFDNVVGNVQP